MAGENEVINQAGTEIANGPPADAPLTPSEVEIGEDDLKNAGLEPPKEPAPEAPKEPAAAEPLADEPKYPKVKKTNRADTRVAAATAEASRLREENERMARELADERARRVNTDHAALDHYEARIRAEVESAERELVDAKKANDPEAEAKATAKLSVAAAKQAQVETFRQANPKPDQKAAPAPKAAAEPRREPAADPNDDLPQEAKDWVASNTWFDPESDDFDKDMHIEARRFANLLEGKMVRQGRMKDIGRSPEYFKAILDHVQAEFPDRFEEPAEPATRKAPAMSRPAAPAAPVGGAAAPGAASAGSKTKVSLSADERKMAHSLASVGAVLNPDGSRMSNAQAEKHFAINKLKTAQNAA